MSTRTLALALLTCSAQLACTSGTAKAPHHPAGEATSQLALRPAQPSISVPKAIVERPSGATESAEHPTEVAKVPTAAERILSLPVDHATSKGQPAYGQLENSVELPASGPGFIANPKRPAEARFAAVPLLQTLLKAAADVGTEEPEAPLVINDLSLANGGPIPHHGSHQNGRDADVLFFVRHANGQPRRAVGVPIAPDGTGTDYRDLSTAEDDVPVVLDVPRTWRLMRALIEHGGDQLQRIFIVEHVRDMLLAEARRVDAPAPVRERFAMLACQPGTPHDDHMHLRFYCTAHDLAQGCEDTGPTYPFRRKALAQLDLKPRLAGPVPKAEKKKAAARTVTPEQARKAAGPMDEAVVRFLDARKAWLDKSTPPRRYCR